MKFRSFLLFFITLFISNNQCFSHEEMQSIAENQNIIEEVKENIKAEENQKNKSYTINDIKNLKTLAALCTIGPLAATLAIGTEDYEEVLLGARLACAIHGVLNAALEDYDLLSGLTSYFNQLSHLQINKPMEGLLSLDLNDTDQIEDLKKVSLVAFFKELGTQAREFFLKKSFSEHDHRITRRIARVILTSVSQAIFDYKMHQHMHSLIPNLILYITEEICGEFIMKSIEWKGLAQIQEQEEIEASTSSETEFCSNSSNEH